MARPIPVLPEVGSTMVIPGRSSPLASAASIIEMPMRSLTEPPGLNDSSLATRGAPDGENLDSLHQRGFAERAEDVVEDFHPNACRGMRP